MGPKNLAQRKTPRKQAVSRGFPTEREGFEPSVAQAPHRFSRPTRSAAPAPLQHGFAGRTNQPPVAKLPWIFHLGNVTSRQASASTVPNRSAAEPVRQRKANLVRNHLPIIYW